MTKYGADRECATHRHEVFGAAALRELVHQAEKRGQFGFAGARKARAQPDLTGHEALICRSYVQK
jgi:hypothetical protein